MTPAVTTPENGTTMPKNVAMRPASESCRTGSGAVVSGVTGGEVETSVITKNPYRQFLFRVSGFGYRVSDERLGATPADGDRGEQAIVEPVSKFKGGDFPE